MIGLEMVYGAVGWGIGVVFATVCMTTSHLVDDWLNERKRKQDECKH